MEENVQEAAVAAKAVQLEDQWAALAKARNLVLVQFHAKVLSKEDLQRHNAEFAAEASAIEWEEAGEDEDGVEVEVEDLPVVKLGKRKAVVLEGDEEEVDKLEADETVPK